MSSKHKKNGYIKKPFESTGISSDTSANIYHTMLLSEAWKALSHNQQVLYLVCKSQYYAEKTKPKDDPLCFTMNQAKWCKKYELYKPNNQAGFYRDMEALISHGFIACVESGKATRTKSIYKYSVKWQKYGTPEFKITISEMTLPMIMAIGKSQ